MLMARLSKTSHQFQSGRDAQQSFQNGHTANHIAFTARWPYVGPPAISLGEEELPSGLSDHPDSRYQESGTCGSQRRDGVWLKAEQSKLVEHYRGEE